MPSFGHVLKILLFECCIGVYVEGQQLRSDLNVGKPRQADFLFPDNPYITQQQMPPYGRRPPRPPPPPPPQPPPPPAPPVSGANFYQQNTQNFGFRPDLQQDPAQQQIPPYGRRPPRPPPPPPPVSGSNVQQDFAFPPDVQASNNVGAQFRPTQNAFALSNPNNNFGAAFQGDANRPVWPNSNNVRNFAAVYNDIDRKAESNYDTAAEDDETDDDFNGRSIVAPGQYPHMAALGFKTSGSPIDFKCGGSLISETFVLTAAHCCYLNGKSPSVVKIGDINLKERESDVVPQRRRIINIYLHPAYNSTLHYHDIGILELNRPIEYTPFVRPIRLWVNDLIPYEKVFTMGYGSTSFAQAPTNILTELDLTIVPVGECNSTLPPNENAPLGILDSQICAKDYEKNRDTCQGDSGGPLQLNLQRRRRKRLRYYLVGITSYGTFCRSPYPGVYTRVASYIDWIASIVWPQYFQNF